MEVPQNNGLSDATLRQYRQSQKDEKINQGCRNSEGYAWRLFKTRNFRRKFNRKPTKVEFKDLSEFNPAYADFDALGWKAEGV